MPAGDDPDRTVTGRAQLDRLKAGPSSADTTWRLVGNPVMIPPSSPAGGTTTPTTAARSSYGTVTAAAAALIRATNRHVQRVGTDRHGYGVLDVTAERAQMAHYVLSDRTRAGATSSRARPYRTRSGTRKVERVYDPVG
ncbi:hypothetical protein GCM10010145_41360 [Streptomyces ruber]|uniref:Uncharacterized protein n=2 Tax=Streptomyces TaxID=1883 RepID=A0A918BGF5_9ACTN|nr:hypothetical protein GCM10010145_41360 [Streptomyces ruber]